MVATHSVEQVSLLKDAAEEIARINIQLAELLEYKESLLSVFKNPATGLEPRTEPYTYGKVLVKVSKNERLDDGLAQRELGHVYKTVSKTTLDTAKARKVLSEDALAKITKKYDNKIEIKLA